jgi:hypothetical protein
MPMVHIREVHVRMGQRRVPVHMRVGLDGRRVMLVEVVRVVNMRVIVLHRLVCVDMLVLGPQEQDDAGRHDCHREQLACAEGSRSSPAATSAPMNGAVAK